MLDQMVHLEHLYQKYKSQANFCFVYISEAHPGERFFEKHVDPSNKARAKQVTMPTESRLLAKMFSQFLPMTIPIYLDSEDGTAERQYRAQPTNVVLIDRSGIILFSSDANDMVFDLDPEYGPLAQLLQPETP